MASGMLVNIGSGNGLLPDRHQAITRTNVELSSIGPQRTYFLKILKIQKFPSSKLSRTCCLQNVDHFGQASMS